MAYKLENNPLFPQGDPDQDTTPTQSKKRGRPQKDNLVRGNSVQEGLTVEYTRATFIMRVDLLEELKDYAYTERLTMKEAVNKLLSEALEREEKRITKQGNKILDRKGEKTK